MKRSFYALLCALLLGCVFIFASCGEDENTENTEHTEHTFSEVVSVEDATCTEPGKKTLKCSCGVTTTEAIAAKGHTIEKIEATPATHTTPGNWECWGCSVCEKIFDDEAATTELSAEEVLIAPMGHTNAEKFTAKDATCTEDGNVEYWYCATCDKNFAGRPAEAEEITNVVIPATGHKDDDGNCVCDVCTGPAHTLVKTEMTQATHTAHGNYEYWTCSVCGKMFFDEAATEEATAETVIITSMGHFRAEKVEAKEAACTVNGSIEYYICYACNKKYDSAAMDAKELTDEEIIIPATGHVLTKVEAKEATCTVNGNIEYWHCTVCEKNYDSDSAEATELFYVIIDAYHNTEYKYEVITPATCTTPGTARDTSTCLVCGEVVYDETYEIPAGHTDEAWDGTCDVCGASICYHANTTVSTAVTAEPTCTEKGTGTQTGTCSDCGEVTFSYEVEIPATGHKDADGNDVCDTCEAAMTLFDKYYANAAAKEDHYIYTDAYEFPEGATGYFNLTAPDYSYMVDVYLFETEAAAAAYAEANAGDYFEKVELVGNMVLLGNEAAIAIIKGEAVTPPDDHTHTLEKVEAKDATCTEAGNIEYWICQDCGKYYADEDATSELTPAQVIISGGHKDADGDYICDDCELDLRGHTHTYGDWIYGNNTHWKEATCGCEDLGKYQEDTHSYDDNGKICIYCGYDTEKEGHTHETKSEWSISPDRHWKETICGHTNIKPQSGNHEDADGDNKCDVCGADTAKEYNPTAKYATYNWDTTTIYVCMNENSNNQELSSELRRYLAGDTRNLTQAEFIDEMVAQRNTGAYATTKVNVVYTYWGEGDTNDAEGSAWGSTIKRMVEQVMANAPGSPDIYVNQIYDMVSASLQKCFANIRSTKMSGGDNNFSFMEQEFVDWANAYGEEWGYMMEYMTELGFSVKKQYLIASDYFIDLVRAFFIVPMNLNMLSWIDESMVSTGDRNEDGVFDVDDFYAMVRAGEWTYDTVIEYSAAIYSGSSATASADDTNGWILSSSNGLAVSAILYTTSVKIFDRTLNEATGFYECTYPDQNEELFNFYDVLAETVSQTGIYVGNDIKLLDVRTKFVEDSALFGGIILLGSLEYQEYQNMKSGAGFGILPVPVYREGDKYLTLIHNMGRIAGIAANTTEFAQCSAFIDYQSTNSSEILEEYYTYKMQYDVAGGTRGNVEILQYIRENVRSAFDKTYEDAIGSLFEDVADNNTWTVYLMRTNFKCTTIRAEYTANKKTRLSFLTQIIESYKDLPE